MPTPNPYPNRVMSTEDLKTQLNITSNDDDGLVTQKLNAAQDWVASFIGKTLSEVTQEQFRPIEEAVLQLAAHWYEQREAVVIGTNAENVPFGVYELLAPYREYVF